MTKTCPRCGADFDDVAGRPGRPKTYCDDPCRKAAWAERSPRRRRRESQSASVLEAWKRTAGTGA